MVGVMTAMVAKLVLEVKFVPLGSEEFGERVIAGTLCHYPVFYLFSLTEVAIACGITALSG